MIIVFGSINMDYRMAVRDFAKAGETIISPSYEISAGGKGANQALACARAGVKTALVGKVGDDGASMKILNNLKRNEVITSGVATSDTEPTGIAVIMVNEKGENQIVVASGANAEVTADQVPEDIIRPDTILLLQMEVPISENMALLERAKAKGSTTILNLAPAFHIPQKMLSLVDYLIVNELEARAIAEVVGVNPDQDLMLLAKVLAAKGGHNCIVTLGGDGAVAMQQDGKGWRVPAMQLEKVVDTTGAGDCFCGTLAASLHAKFALGSAMRRASVAASLSCTKEGAQESYPFLDDIEKALESFPQAQPV